MPKLTSYCLLGLGLACLLGGMSLDLWELARLVVVVLGLAWVATGQRFERHSAHYRLVLICGTYFFLVAQFVHPASGPAALAVALCTGGVAWSGGKRGLPPGARWDRAFFSVVGLCLLVQIWMIADPTAAVAGLAFSWQSILLVGEGVALYWGLSRLSTGSGAAVAGRRALLWALVVCAGVAAIGSVRVGQAAYRSTDAMDSFASGDFDRVRELVADLDPAATGLRWERASRDTVFAAFAEIAAERGGRHMVEVGNIAMDHGAWGVAATAYRRVAAVTPDYPAIRAWLGDALFEQGLLPEAMAEYDRGMRRSGAGVEEFLAAAGSLARSGRWTEANALIDSALVRASPFWPPSLGRAEEVIEIVIGELLPPTYQRVLAKLTLFEVVSLCRARGWTVLHPGMEIGTTGIVAPVDIVVRSGGGQWNGDQEEIVVDGNTRSPNNQGINALVIDPTTGAVEASGNFNTRLYRTENGPLALLINRAGRGKIIAASVVHDGATELLSAGRDALTGAGARDQPVAWGSYALLGVQGTRPGSGLTRASRHGQVQVGVLAANIATDVSEDRTRLVKRLRRDARQGGGTAVFIAGVRPEDRLVAFKTREQR